jgi:antitoxin (DNA-binding transcriptional repressor) of toxin-antitoxin stability system
MITIAADEASSRLDSLLTSIEERGEIVLICRDDLPIAEIRPVKRASGLPIHPQLSKVQFHEGPVAPLEPEDWMQIPVTA